MDGGLETTDRTVRIGDVSFGARHPLAVIAGPCVIESPEHCLRLAEQVVGLCGKLGLGYVFKASFDKANRTRLESFRGPGLEEGLKILERIRRKVGVPVLSDIHEPAQAAAAGEVLDALQIPAFLCRQTDLIVAAARTGKPLNIKKGQFVSPEDMRYAVEKAASVGNEQVLLCERGTFFGYGRLVNDMTGLAVMRQWAPVVFDATHSVQRPGAAGGRSGGDRQFVPVLARAAVAAGCDALFLEIHDDPASAKSDAATVWPVDRLESLLRECAELHRVIAQGR